MLRTHKRKLIITDELIKNKAGMILI